MSRLLDMLVSSRVSPDPVSVLWHYIRGQMCDWTNGENGVVRWKTNSHRGVQWLNKVEFPRKQKRYIFSPQFEIRYNQRFEEVIRECASLKREGKTWISEEYILGMIELNKMGFANSYEAWHNNELVGGAFGVQIGSIITCDSMFHRMSNASKAAYGQTLVRLQQRGFRMVDTNGVAAHQVNYGEEWMPEWQYEKWVMQFMHESPSLTDERAYPKYPGMIKALLPLLKAARKMGKLVPWRGPKETGGKDVAGDVSSVAGQSADVQKSGEQSAHSEGGAEKSGENQSDVKPNSAGRVPTSDVKDASAA